MWEENGITTFAARQSWEMRKKLNVFCAFKQRCSWFIHECGLSNVRRGVLAAIGGYSSLSPQPQCSAVAFSLCCWASHLPWLLFTFLILLSGSWRYRFLFAVQTVRKPLCVIFFFFIFLFHIAYSQQLIHSIVDQNSEILQFTCQKKLH